MNIKIKSNDSFYLNEDYILITEDNRNVLVNTSNSSIKGYNHMGIKILKKILEGKKVYKIIEELLEVYKEDYKIIKEDVICFIKELVQNKIIIKKE